MVVLDLVIKQCRGAASSHNSMHMDQVVFIVQRVRLISLLPHSCC